MSDPTAQKDDGVPAPPPVPEDPTALRWLTPNFRPDEHGLYLKRLMGALADKSKTGPRNIALTGSYGSGKSSVLEGLLGKWRYHAVRISLSTINPANLPPTIDPGQPKTQGQAAEAEAEARLISNIIQKEIVKQILYRQTRRKMSGSRFRRIEKFHWLAAIARSLLAALVVSAIAYLAGWTSRFEDLISTPILQFAWWGPVIVVASAVLALAIVFLVVQRGLHGRIRIKALSAGSAQIELKDDESAFDRYLDEIVYFFSVSRCTVAIFEDLDRFQRIEIYEELRSLNVLLNNSKQLRKPVRFVYAMRDSLFEEIAGITARGRDADALENADEQSPDEAELNRLVESAADRAKFFDLVLPMVPFATLRTSLDLWIDEVPDSTRVTRDALRIAARHVHDMRLIRNVSNEFHVFSEELTKNKIGGLRPDEIFALMLYKNVYLDDFEGIRTGLSVLDTAERRRQDTITETLFAWDAEDTEERDGTTAEARRVAVASTAGGALMTSIQNAYAIAGRAVPQAIVFRVGGSDFVPEQIGTVEFWARLAAEAWTFQIIYGSTTPRPVARTIAELTEMVGFDPSTIDWTESSTVSNLHSAELRDRLQRAELKDLLEDERLLDDEARATLRTELRKLLKSELVFELVAAGMIDQNFSLYVSRFYGRTVSAVAMNFILHVGQTGRFVPLAQLNGKSDVQAVLAELGDDLMTSSPALNVNLFDALIEDSRLDLTIASLEDLSRAEDFLDLYLQVGASREALAGRLAGAWPGTFRFLTGEGRPDSIDLGTTLDRALMGAKADVSYEPAPRLTSMINSRLTELPSLTSDTSQADPGAIVSLLRANGGLVEDLSKLSPSMRSAFVADGRFVVSPANLEMSLGKGGAWSLDVIPEESQGVLNRALTDLDEYLAALPRSNRVLTKQKGFAGMVERVYEEAGLDGLAKVLARSTRTLTINDLKKVPVETWKELARDRRITPSSENLDQYRVEFGLDASIAQVLSSSAAPDASSLEDADARALAVALLKLDGVAPTKKVKYIKSLRLGSPLTTVEIDGVGGDVVSYLAPAELIADTAETYIALRTRDWATRAAWIKRAPAFATYVADIKFTDAEMFEIFRGDLPTAKKLVIAKSDISHPDKLSARSATALGKFLVGPNLGQIPSTVLDGLARDGCEPAVMIQVLDNFQVQPPRLTDRLALMPRPWRDLSGKAARKPLIPWNRHSEVVLQRLKDANVVTSWGEPENGAVRAQVRKV